MAKHPPESAGLKVRYGAIGTGGIVTICQSGGEGDSQRTVVEHSAPGGTPFRFEITGSWEFRELVSALERFCHGHPCRDNCVWTWEEE